MSVSESRTTGVDFVTPTQCRMARAALRIGVRDLAVMAKVAPGSVARFEAGATLHDRTIAAMHNALEKAGVQFVGDHGVHLNPNRPKGRRK